MGFVEAPVRALDIMRYLDSLGTSRR